MVPLSKFYVSSVSMSQRCQTELCVYENNVFIWLKCTRTIPVFGHPVTLRTVVPLFVQWNKFDCGEFIVKVVYWVIDVRPVLKFVCTLYPTNDLLLLIARRCKQTVVLCSTNNRSLNNDLFVSLLICHTWINSSFSNRWKLIEANSKSE